MLPEIEMWGYFLICGILFVFYILSARREGMTALARNAISASVSVLYLCGHFADHMQSLTDHLYLLGMALFMVFLGYQAWTTGRSEISSMKVDDLKVGDIVQ